jgi:hypothetical protein
MPQSVADDADDADMTSSLFKDEKRTQYSPLMTREEQVRDGDLGRDGRRRTDGWETDLVG